jgi:hypothetical protein
MSYVRVVANAGEYKLLGRERRSEGVYGRAQLHVCAMVPIHADDDDE